MKKFSLGSMLIGIVIGIMLFGGTSAVAASVTANTSSWKVFVGGYQANVEAYMINDSNYLKLRDVCSAVDCGVWYDSNKKEIYLELDKHYDPNYTGLNGFTQTPVPFITSTPLPTPAPTPVPIATAPIRIGGVIVEDIDYLGGIDVRIFWRNQSKKDIKYITFTVQPYNRVGDRVSSSIGDKVTAYLEVTGPIKPFSENNIGYSYIKSSRGNWEIIWTSGGYHYFHSYTHDLSRINLTAKDYPNVMDNGNIWSTVWYNSTIETIKITKVDIEYMDGSKESYSGSVLDKLIY